MKKAIIIMTMAFLMIACNKAYSQIEFDYTGYIYNLPSIMKMPEALEMFGLNNDKEYFLMDLNRFRFMPDLMLGDNSRITLHYEIDALWSEFSLPYLSTNGMTNRQALDLNWSIVNENKFQMNHYIDMLYFKQMFDFGEITLGRQVVSWGVGRIWQPMDLFNPINPANFSKFEKDGADAVSAVIYLGMFSDLELVYNFREKWQDANFGGRIRTNYEMFDLSMMGGYFDKQGVIGASFSGDLLGAGVRGEGIFSYNSDSPDSSFVRLIIGADYQFSSDFYILIEYLYNGEGTDCELCYELERLFKGEILNVAKHYVALQTSYKLHPLVNMNLGANVNLNDQSGYSNLSFSWDTLENLKLTAAGIYFLGDKLSEYSYYSTAFYLMGQFYF
jgi:hypothetical protein